MRNQEQGICPKMGKFASGSDPKQCFQLPELIHSIASSSGIPDFDFCPNIIRRFGIPPLSRMVVLGVQPLKSLRPEGASPQSRNNKRWPDWQLDFVFLPWNTNHPEIWHWHKFSKPCFEHVALRESPSLPTGSHGSNARANAGTGTSNQVLVVSLFCLFCLPCLHVYVCILLFVFLSFDVRSATEKSGWLCVGRGWFSLILTWKGHGGSGLGLQTRGRSWHPIGSTKISRSWGSEVAVAEAILGLSN
jgi:hypothetical protein